MAPISAAVSGFRAEDGRLRALLALRRSRPGDLDREARLWRGVVAQRRA